jgi:hypothetical protein
MGQFKSLIAQLPDGQFQYKNDYRLDYMIHSASSNFEEEQRLWDYPLYEVYKYMMLKKFKSWIEWGMTSGK